MNYIKVVIIYTILFTGCQSKELKTEQDESLKSVTIDKNDSLECEKLSIENKSLILLKFWEGMKPSEYDCIKKRLIKEDELDKNGYLIIEWRNSEDGYLVADGTFENLLVPMYHNDSLEHIWVRVLGDISCGEIYNSLESRINADISIQKGEGIINLYKKKYGSGNFSKTTKPIYHLLDIIEDKPNKKVLGYKDIITYTWNSNGKVIELLAKTGLCKDDFNRDKKQKVYSSMSISYYTAKSYMNSKNRQKLENEEKSKQQEKRNKKTMEKI